MPSSKKKVGANDKAGAEATATDQRAGTQATPLEAPAEDLLGKDAAIVWCVGVGVDKESRAAADERAAILKDAGNAAFAKQDYPLADEQWDSALKVLGVTYLPKPRRSG